MKKLLFFLVLASSSILNAQTPSFVRDSLDNYINQGLKDWDIPGLAIVIVKDGKVAVMKGYGLRDIDTKEKVDINTLFMIASNSKLFTGTAFAQLAFNKKINLNDKISKYYPDYALYDTLTSRSVTIRDMLSHRIGTKTFQGDFTFWNSELSRAEIMQRMRLLKPIGLFRQDYGYCNSCFMTAGQIIPKVTGREWEQYVQDSILTPLEMTHSTTISRGMEQKENVSRPYTNNYTGKITRIPYDEWDNLGPAASIISNVSDLSHWLQFQLDSGKYNGKRIMPFNILQATRDINIATSSRKSGLYPIHFRGYGLGIFMADYNGRQIYWHTGGAGGMVSNVCFVPEERLGIAILTNNDNQNFFEDLRYQVLDAYLGVNYVNRSKASLEGFKKQTAAQLKEIEGWKSRLKNNKPTLPLAAYAGTYQNQLYGTVTITTAGFNLKVKLNSHKNLTATLTYLDNNDWLLQYDNIEYGIFTIQFKEEQGKATGVLIRMNDFVEFDPYMFTRQL